MPSAASAPHNANAVHHPLELILHYMAFSAPMSVGSHFSSDRSSLRDEDRRFLLLFKSVPPDYCKDVHLPKSLSQLEKISTEHQQRLQTLEV